MNISNETTDYDSDYGSNYEGWRWTAGNDADYWILMICSSLILVVGLINIRSTLGGIGTIQDLLCDLADATESDGWWNVDYGTEGAKFFSYWTCLPWIIVTYAILASIDGIVGIVAVAIDDQTSLKESYRSVMEPWLKM